MSPMKGNNGGQKKAKFFTSRIYAPYPIEVTLKIISWTVLIVIDIIDLILVPFIRMGIKCFCVFAVLASIFSGYMFFSFGLLLRDASLLFLMLLVSFLAFVCATRLLKYILTKLIRPPFAEIVFESVAVSFRRPFAAKQKERLLLKRPSADQMTDLAIEESYNPQSTD